MKLKDLIATYPYILDIPIELLECVDFNKLEESKDDYTFQDASDLVDTFLNSIDRFKEIAFEGSRVLFTIKDDIFTVTDEYNNFAEVYSCSEDKVKILHNLLYYYVALEEWQFIYKDINISVRDYKKLKEMLI